MPDTTLPNGVNRIPSRRELSPELTNTCVVRELGGRSSRS